ncbi:N2227-domain-containing protein [Wilcoxina mikolae CBS 423.85]|nr:N2227-domain-containing protein [Wilcoxina mikolae CBS 423.85]
MQYPILLSYFHPNDAAAVTGLSGERGKVLAALAGYSMYKQRTANELHKKRSAYNKLKAHHKSLLASTVKYVPKISNATKTVEVNNKLARAIRDHGLRYYNITPFELRAYERMQRSAGDHKHVVQALKHFVRDWSVDGVHERDATFPQILHTLDTLFPKSPERGGVRVLVPGAGLGRLAYELAAKGFDVVANEYSTYVNLACRYMFSLHTGNPDAKTDMHAFHPNINWWSHQRTTESLLRAVTFPDTLPSREALTRLKLVEGDFLSVFLPHEKEAFDVVTTLFFIDTARNIVAYLETIYTLLKPGGVWVNLGPLLYGTAPWVELSLDEVLKVAEKIGFELMMLGEEWGEDTFPEVEHWKGKVRGKLAGYSWDQEGLSRNAYLAQGWVARRGM